MLWHQLLPSIGNIIQALNLSHVHRTRIRQSERQKSSLLECRTSNFFKAFMPPRILLLYILFFKSSWREMASAAWNWVNSVPNQQRRPLPSLLSDSSSMGIPTVLPCGLRGPEKIISWHILTRRFTSFEIHRFSNHLTLQRFKSDGICPFCHTQIFIIKRVCFNPVWDPVMII